MQDIDEIMNEIADLESRIEQVSEETKSKLKLQPNGGGTTKPIYPNSGLYVGGDPSLEEEDDDVPNKTTTAPPQKAFSITSSEGEEDDNSHPEKDSWMPAPPSTPPPAVPSA